MCNFRVLYLVLSLFLSSRLSKAYSFMPGDVLLAPMNCFLCKLIEGETGSSYSHLFVYISDGNFAHSLNNVEYISLNNIKKIVDTKRPMLLTRHKNAHDFQSNHLKRTFEESYLGLPYDKDFLWNNMNERGKEKLYCSEFVLKILNDAFKLSLLPSPMTYDYYPELWDDYFSGDTPSGLPGVTPGFFENHVDFNTVKFIYP